MNIFCPVSAFYPFQNGGPALSLFGFCKCIIDSEHKAFVFTKSQKVNLSQYSLKPNSFNNFDFGQVYYSTSNFFIYQLRLIIFFFKNRNKLDIIFITSIFDVNNFLILFVSSLCNKKIIISPRGELDPLALKFKIIKKRLFLYLFKLLIKKNKKIIFHCTSQQEANYLCNYFKDSNYFVVPNFQELPAIDKTIEISNLYFLYIGRLDPKKGIENLIYGYKEYCKLVNNPKPLLIVGTGKKSYLNRLISISNIVNNKSAINFLGFKSDSEKFDLYRNAFYTIVPSFTENFANVVVESLSQGTPVIASKGTPWESLKIHDCGYWIHNDPKTIYQQLLVVDSLENEKYLTQRFNSTKYYINEFSIQKGTKVWNHILKALE